MTHVTRSFKPLVVAAAIAATGALAAAAAQPARAPVWVVAWSTSQQVAGATAVTNATVRMMARVTIPGSAVRIRLDNTFGDAPVTIGKAYVGQRATLNATNDGGAMLIPGSNHPATFKGAASVTIPVGGTVVSDAVPMTVIAQQDLAVSLFVTGSAKPSQHSGAVVTSYLSAADSGDASADESAKPFTATTTSMLWLKAVDVQSASAAGAYVALGDSITDGTCTTLDAHNRWEDWLAVRIAMSPRDAGGPIAIVNEGIGANTITRENLEPAPSNTPALERLDRDVFSHAGVTGVFMFLGTNDINRGAKAAQVIGGIQEVAKQVRAHHLRLVGSTILARHTSVAAGRLPPWNADKTHIKNEVNEWIRTKMPFDALVDFDKVVRDASNSDLITPAFNCDGTHPSPRGYFEMGTAIPLNVLKAASQNSSR